MLKSVLFLFLGIAPLVSGEFSITQLADFPLLPVGEPIESKEVDNIVKEYFSRVQAADYLGAVHILVEGLKIYPHSFRLQANFATVLGDYGDILSDRGLVQKSKEVFEKLRPEIATQPKHRQFYFNNEYNWRFALHKEQYENGIATVNEFADIATLGCSGYYYQGVGAAHYAKQLLIEGDEPLAKEYARRAVVAWAQYFSYKNTYYNAYVHYGLALGILGEIQEMMRALQRGADLINTDLNYCEFKEVIEFVRDYGSSES